MRKHLRYDEETRELRLVYSDLWNGSHERTEYRVTDMRGGAPLRGSQWAGMDGRAVSGHAPDLYLKPVGPFGATDRAPMVWTEPTAVGPTVKTPCPGSANARRKCALCADSN
jgi:hypothetical protein